MTPKENARRACRGARGRCAAAMLALAGCVHPLAFVPGLRCFQIPGDHLPGTSVESFDVNLMSAYLRSLGEPILWRSRVSPTPTIRLSLAGYANRPVSIRIEHENESTIRIHATRLQSTGCPSRLAFLDYWQRKEASGEISRDQWDMLSDLFKEADLDRAAMLEPLSRAADSEETVVITDGTQYLVEYRDPRGYRAVLRHSSSQLVRSPSFAKLCREIITVSPLPLGNEAATACSEPAP
jgi:hypothetical protein